MKFIWHQVIYLDTSLPSHDGEQISEDNLAREKHDDQELRPLRDEDLWNIIKDQSLRKS